MRTKSMYPYFSVMTSPFSMISLTCWSCVQPKRSGPAGPASPSGQAPNVFMTTVSPISNPPGHDDRMTAIVYPVAVRRLDALAVLDGERRHLHPILFVDDAVGRTWEPASPSLVDQGPRDVQP